ncbi:MAG: Gfo/Idh/MocA family protein [Clostridia bacterium]
MGKNNSIRVGIIGLGGVGGRLFRSFLAHSETTVTAVCDTDAGRARQAAEEAGGIPWFTDYKQLLGVEQLDLVYIAVPPVYHHQVALDVIRAGKHIFCEKPLANSLEQARDMLEAAEQAGIVHAMNFPTYYRAAFRKLVMLLEEGYLGELRRVEVSLHFHEWPRPWQQNAWIAGREQGGFVREVMPHYIHLLHTMFGSIASVTSQLEYPDDPSACETGIVAVMQLENGVSVLVNGVSQIAREEHISFTLYGTNGTLSIVNWARLEGGGQGEAPQPIPVSEIDHLAEMITQLVASIRGEVGDLVDFHAGYEVQDVLEKLLRG